MCGQTALEGTVRHTSGGDPSEVGEERSEEFDGRVEV